MKRIFAILGLILLVGNVVLADDGDLWDNFGDTNQYGQKAVSDEDFEKALQSKQKKKKPDKNIPKGASFSQSNETQALKNSTADPQVLLVPVTLKVDNKYIIPIGHYEVEGVKEDGEIYLKFYQAHDLIAKVPAEETDDDFGEDTINFVKLSPHGDYHVEVDFGGVNFNAYSIIDIE
jgi:hypothetical protein